jgi:hypothetical protein
MRIGDSCIYLAVDVSGTRELQHDAADGGILPDGTRHAMAAQQPAIAACRCLSRSRIQIGCRLDRLRAHVLIGEARGSGNGRSK